MSAELDGREGTEAVVQHDLMSIFDELSFREKWRKVFHGLRMPRETGEYKFARLQMIRLSAPISAVIVPLLMFALLVLLSAITPKPVDHFTVENWKEPEKEVLDPVEEPTPEKTTEVVEVTFKEISSSTAEVSDPSEDYSQEPAVSDAVALIDSIVIMTDVHGDPLTGIRGPDGREDALEEFGGDDVTEMAVMRALRWLKVNQDEAGSWGRDKPAMTALVVLAYLAHAETPESAEFGYTVEKALRYLLAAQTDDGKFAGGDGHEYTTPIVAYALCEAYGLMPMPQLHDAAQKSLVRVIKGQNAHGGFNYNLKGPSDTRNDLSYIAWCVQALKAGKMAEVEADGLATALARSIEGVKKNYGATSDYGGFGYAGPGASGLTGAGILCLQFLGEGDSQAVQNGLASVDQAVCAWDVDQIDAMHRNDPLYYWYYLTQAKFQSGGTTWEAWNEQFSPVLVENQDVVEAAASGYVDHEGISHSIGSWPEGVPGTKVHGGTQEGVFPTVLCTLMLEVYYRYLPTFQVPKEVVQGEALDEDGNDLVIEVVEGKG